MARANHTETITRLRFASGVAVHTLLPPHDIDGYTTTSRPFAIGVSFTGHGHAVLESVGGARFTRSFGPGTIGINGPQPVRWLRVAERSEGLEIIPSQVLLAAAADEFDITWTSLDRFLQVERDPVVWGICARYRMAILGAWPLPELQSDELTWGLLAHVAGVYFGAQAPRPRVGRLDPRRLARVAEFIESSLPAAPSLKAIAAIAALSPHHFHRQFRRTTGLTPHDYVNARRMERARRMLEGPRLTVRQVAAELGFADLSHFRRTYRRHLNSSPRGTAGRIAG